MKSKIRNYTKDSESELFNRKSLMEEVGLNNIKLEYFAVLQESLFSDFKLYSP